MTIYEEIAQEFDQWALNNRAESMGNGHWDVTVQMLQKIVISADDVVLDVGCGNGWLVRELLGKGCQKGYGIDISEKMIKEAQRCSIDPKHEIYAVSNAENLDFTDNYFSLITNIESLYYYPEPKKALEEWYRISKKNGQLAIMMDLYQENPATHNWVEALNIPVHVFSKEQLRDWLTECGWQNIQMFQIQDRRPVKTESEFTASAYWPSYEQYLEYRRTGSLCIVASK